ncbi:hypothetical protein SLEP1_g44645 [Rubroshorea leprosula]|uniref:Major facilitator superfamily (MFS) profile domain-containing protein n=1 Tax=Rubroshorea leprosula TaxID=152421 RepID=A0AAV5LH85_9ROSI|nr:hypothetical protein SLEP1_g44645 [Rubroshorea leprosula]
MSLAVVGVAIVTAVGKVETWIVTAFDKAKEWVVATIVPAVVAVVGKAKGWVLAAIGKAKEWIVATIGKAKESARHYKGGLYVFLTCIVAVVDGLLFGYNIGNSGQIMLGSGTGFEEHVVPLYLSEMSPIHLQGIIKSVFKLAIKLGAFIANVVNYRTKKLDYSRWKISLGLTGVLALFVTMGAILLPKTSKGLIEQGKREKGRRILAKIRGIDDVNIEFEDMIHVSDLANSIEHPFTKMLERRNIPILVMAIFMPAFKILMVMSFILFYTPVFFQSIGFGENASLYCSVDIVAVMVVSIFISIAIVDRLG